MSTARVVAVDLGASSGRVFLGSVDAGALELREVARFWNGAVPVADTLYWDLLRLHRGVLDGLRAAGRLAGSVDSVGIDSWAVDYGIIDRTGALVSNPVHHRDARTLGVVEEVLARIPAPELYRRTGVQLQRFDTLFQLAAAAGSPALDAAQRLLLVPDLLGYFLTGVEGTEETNASTTALLAAHGLEWDRELLAIAGVRPDLLAPLRRPGDPAGDLLPAVLEDTGLEGRVPLTTVASHDTASAVAAVPASGEHFAYVSCGTWSLVGLELPAPVIDEASRLANFTNERGLDGTTRYLRNVMGLWLLQESIRTWSRAGLVVEVDDLVREAASLPALASVVDVDDDALLAPGDMPARIAAACRATGQAAPRTPGEVTRCVLDSLALAYRRAIERAKALAHRDVDTVHLVGGGARNALLCQLTADACGCDVVAGPAEAAAIGNVLVQARAMGALGADLPGLRAVVRAHTELPVYRPTPGGAAAFDAAGSRLHP